MTSLAPLVLADARRVGALAAELVRNRLVARPRARLLLEPGRTPREMYGALRAHARRGDLPSGGATILQLDEYVGTTTLAGRLRAELQGVAYGALATIDGTAADLEAEAARHAAELDRVPVDLAVLALGEDGHVAFDEPPARLASGVRVVTLAPDSREAGGPERALTVGLGSLYRARELIVLATGRATAPALRAMLERPAAVSSPASLLLDHPRLTVICDREAASLLTPRPGFAGDRVLVVLGHREPGISAEHRISFESRARLRHARRLAARRPPRAVILTGYSSTGGLSEAEQMKGAWREDLAPALLEVAGRNTAENASRTLPLVLALDGIRKVVVVTSAWHIRTPWFFAPYRRFGLDVGYRVSFAHGRWPRMLVEELRGARSARAQRRAAMAAVDAPRP